MEYITPIYDRTQADVITAGNVIGLINPKGTINYIDLNRIENNTRVVADTMLKKGIVKEYIKLNSKYNWVETDIPTKSDINRIINNILLLKQYSIQGLQLEPIGLNAQWSWQLANAIEKNLDIMYKQEPRPEGTYNLEVVNGTGSGQYLDNTVVPIEAYPPNSNKLFKYWSGDAEDLAQVENTKASSTTFTVNHQDAKLTATYLSSIPHKFKILNGTCTNLTNPDANQDNYMEGDIIRISANPCPLNMVYWGWIVIDYEGEADQGITRWTIEDGFTYQTAQITTFVMPAADVEITAKYIHPGDHTLKVVNGLGSGEYSYSDLVSISSMEDELSNDDWEYKFEYWSGPGVSLIAEDYEYLDDAGNPIAPTKSPRVTLYMEDFNSEITANYSRKLKEPSIVEVTTLVINADDLEAFNNRSDEKAEADRITQIADIPGISVLSKKEYTKFSEVPISVNTNDIVDEDGIKWRFSYWVLLTSITGRKDEEDLIIYKLNFGNPFYTSSTNYTIGNSFTTIIAVREQVYDVKLEHCTAKSINGEIVSKDNVLTIPAMLPFLLIADTSDLDDGYDSTKNVITNDGYNVSDNGIVSYRGISEFYLNANEINTDDILSIKYWRVFRNKYYYTARIFPDGDINSEGILTDVGIENSAITLNADTTPEGQEFTGWYVGTVNRYTTMWHKLHNSTPTMVTYFGNELLLPNACTPDDPGQYFYRPMYSALPAEHELIIRIYSDDGSTYTEKTEMLKEGYLYRMSAPNPTNTISHRFLKWTETIKGSINNLYSQDIKVSLREDCIISAYYEEKEKRQVTIIGGIIEGYDKTSEARSMYVEQTVNIKADDPEENMIFVGWAPIKEGGKDTSWLTQASSQNTMLYIGNSDIAIKAVYKKPEDLTSYQLVLVNGYSSGKYEEGSKVGITAVAPDDGYEFWKWEGVNEVFQTEEDKYKSEVEIIMPPYPITLTAKYKLQNSTPVYTLIVNYGTIIKDNTGETYFDVNEADFEEGTIVTIKANPLDDIAAQNSKFYQWTGNIETVENISSETTTVTIGKSDITLNATYIGLEDYVLRVKNGTGSGAYKEGTKANIIANLKDDDTHEYIFQEWIGDIEYIENINEKDTYVTIPQKDVSVEAKYITKYYLEVVNGTGSGFYEEGSEINVSADNNFISWSGDTDYISNIYSHNLVITMPNSPIKIVAKIAEANDPNSIGIMDALVDDMIKQISGKSDIGNIILEKTTGSISIQTDLEFNSKKVKNGLSPRQLTSSSEVSSLKVGDIYTIEGD